MRLFLNFFKKDAKKIWRYGKKRYFCNPKRNGAVVERLCRSREGFKLIEILKNKYKYNKVPREYVNF